MEKYSIPFPYNISKGDFHPLFGPRTTPDVFPEELKEHRNYEELKKFLDSKGFRADRVVFLGRDGAKRALEHGVTVRNVRTHLMVYPRVKYEHHEVLRQMSLPEVAGAVETLVAFFGNMDLTTRRAYCDYHKIVRLSPDADRYAVLPLISPKFDQLRVGPRVLDEEYLQSCEARWIGGEFSDRPTKAFDYVRTLDDKRMARKYPLNHRQKYEVETLLYRDPVRMAKMLGIFMTMAQSRWAVTVRIGGLIHSTVLAERSLDASLATYAASAVPVKFDGDQAIVEFGEAEYGLQPTISGPAKYARHIARLAAACDNDGMQLVASAFEVEISSLGLTIDGGVTPVLTADFLKFQSDCVLPDPMEQELPEAVQLAVDEAKDALLPVGDVGGNYGTAVAIARGVVLINNHVVAAAVSPNVNGKPLVAFKSAGRDLHFARVDIDVAPAVVRAPVVDEVLYPVACAKGGELRLCAPTRVIELIAGLIKYERNDTLIAGCSGAALFAADGALVGVHSGVTSGFAFGPSLKRGVVADASASLTGCIAGESLTKHFGPQIRRVKAVLDTCVSVPIDIVRSTLGMSQEGRIYVCPDYAPVAEHRYNAGYFEIEEPAADTYIPYVREPLMGEPVVAVGLDAKVYGKSYIIEVGKRVVTAPLALPIGGAVLFAMDGCVLGFSGQHAFDTALGPGVVFRLPPKAKVVERADVNEWLNTLGVQLNVDVPEEIYRPLSAINLSQRSLAAWALIGDAWLRMQAVTEVVSLHVPERRRSAHLEQVLNNSFLRDVCHSSGLANCLSYFDGAKPPETSKHFADVVEALFGWLSVESEEDAFYLRRKLQMHVS